MWARRSSSRRRGATVILVMLALVVLLGLAALAIDLGRVYLATAEMHRTADASALGGASGLMERHARSRAYDYALLNPVLNQPVPSQDVDVTIGNWDGAARTFTPTPDEGVNDVLPNAVRVVGTRPSVGFFFAPLFGHYFTHVRRTATALAGAGRCAGVWGLEGITFDGNVLTDSYDSSAGHYGPGNIRPNGDVCSCRDIIANGGISIHGDAMYGDGYAFVPYGSSYTVLGLIAEQVCSVPDVDVDYAAAALNNDNAIIPLTFRGRDPFAGNPSNLYVTGNDHLTLPPGTFYFNSALLDGQAYLEITGPTTLYIDGNATLTGGGVVNVTGNPRDLVIYARGPSVALSGNATFYGAVVAPTATVRTMGTFNAYGTVLSRILDCDGDAQFHIEESLVFELFGIKSLVPTLVE